MALGAVFGMLAVSEPYERKVWGSVAIIGIGCGLLDCLCYEFMERQRQWAVIVAIAVSCVVMFLSTGAALLAFSAFVSGSGFQALSLMVGLSLAACALVGVVVVQALSLRAFGRSPVAPHGSEPLGLVHPNVSDREK